jgi:ArsR family transcriptional regulator
MRADLPTEAELAPAVRALADPLRARIIELLATEQLCVCHLTEELDVAQPLVSHHLKVLREAGLVDSERWRYWTYYRLRPDALRALAERLEGLAAAAPTETRNRRPCC